MSQVPTSLLTAIIVLNIIDNATALDDAYTPANYYTKSCPHSLEGLSHISAHRDPISIIGLPVYIAITIAKLMHYEPKPYCAWPNVNDID